MKTDHRALTLLAESKDKTVQRTLTFIQNVLGGYDTINFAIRFWDGTTWQVNPRQPVRFRLLLKHPGALRAMFFPPTELTICEAFFYDDFDIEGDFNSIFEVGQQVRSMNWRLADVIRWGIYLLTLPSKKSSRSGRYKMAGINRMFHRKKRNRHAIAHHYDVSNDFYKLWLDKNMVYSGAYFTSPDLDIDAAQELKLDYICRKLQLRSGEHFLDIGCGWGGLVIHAARHYGVKAYGITLSKAQADLANERIHQLGLTDCCHIEICDYWDINETETYHKIASVEMLHHINKSKLSDYFEKVRRLLRPEGISFHLGITLHTDMASQKGPNYAKLYFMPDYCLVPISTLLHYAEIAGFEIHDVENLREHYELTAQLWLKRLEDRHDKIKLKTNEVIYRVWRLSLALMKYGFQTGLLNLYHMVLINSHNGRQVFPLTRTNWYK